MPARKYKTFNVTRTWRGGEITPRMRHAVPVATAAGAEFLLGRALEQVPVESAALAESGHTQPAQSGDGTDVVFDSVYAAVQHEVPMNHTPGANGEPAGKDHYLSDPATENRNEIYGIMANIMRKALG